MFRRRFTAPALILSILLLFASLCAADDSRTAKSKLAGIAPEARFSFAILGDTRSATPIVQPDDFKQIIREINLLRPTLVVNLGDLIRGYTKDKDLLKQEWDEFIKVTSECRSPWFPVPGNHDMFDQQSQDVYAATMGELYYSFDYGDSHFVVLNSDIVGYVNKVSPEQMGWLKADLAANSEKRLFVFIHKPLWSGAGWDAWQPMHRLLKQYKTEGVFAGHQHVYRNDTRDGIRYIVTGGGGAPTPAQSETGGFHHYMLVTVEEGQVTCAVVKPGSVYDENVVTPESIALARKVDGSFVLADIPSLVAGREIEVLVTINNQTDGLLKGELAWQTSGMPWKVDPMSRAYSVEAGQTKQLRFKAVHAGDGKPGSPMPQFLTKQEYMPGRIIEIRRTLKVVPPTPPK